MRPDKFGFNFPKRPDEDPRKHLKSAWEDELGLAGPKPEEEDPLDKRRASVRAAKAFQKIASNEGRSTRRESGDPSAKESIPNKPGNLLDGRAEYELVGKKDLFESKKPTEIYPFVKTEGYAMSLAIAHRGSGKTFFMRKLKEQLEAEGKAVEINFLDKINLKWVGKQVAKPSVIIFDDLHYLLEAKRLNELKGQEVITEDEILNILRGGVNRAKKDNAKIIFVSDEDVYDMYDRFKNPDNQRAFVEIMMDKTMSEHDFKAWKQSGYFRGQNILKFRDQFDEGALMAMRKTFGMTDVPFAQGRLLSDRVVYPDKEIEALFGSSQDGEIILITGEDLEENYYSRALAGAENLAFELAKKRMILSSINKSDGVMEQADVSKTEAKIEANPFDINKKQSNKGIPIITGNPVVKIRILSALNKILGPINRSNLGLKLGKPSDSLYYSVGRIPGSNIYRRGNNLPRGGWFYTADNIGHITKILITMYYDLTQRGEFMPLARRLLTAPDPENNEDADRLRELIHIEHKMGQE